MLDAIANLKREGMMEKPQTPIGIATELFKLHNRSEGKSPRTVEWYETKCRMLQAENGPFSPQTPMGDISEIELRLYIADLTVRPKRGGGTITVASLNNYVRGFKKFFRWAYEEGFTQTWLLEKLRAPRVPQTLIETLTDEEIGAIQKEVSATPVEHALFNLMLDTGLRSSEVARLRLDEVDVKSGTLNVIGGKGGKSRTVPFGIAVQKLTLGYVMNHRPETELQNLFISPAGIAYTPVSLRTLMRRVGRRTGIKRLHAHLLRHTYATRFLEAGGNALYLKMNLGHSTLAMTDRYIHLVGQRAAAASRQFSPLDRYIENRRQNRAG